MKKESEINIFYDETVFVFPFSFDGGLRKWKRHFEQQNLGRYWVNGKDIYSKYMYKHVYNNENRAIHYEYKDGSLDWNYENSMNVHTSLTGDGRREEYSVIPIGFSLFVYPTGLGFLTFRVRYPQEDASLIADFSAAFSRVCANERTDVNAKVYCLIGNGKRTFAKMLEDSVGRDGKNDICFFPCTNNRRAFVFHRLIQETLTENQKHSLRKNIWVDNADTVHGLTDLECDMELGDYRLCLLSPMVMCVVTGKSKQDLQLVPEGIEKEQENELKEERKRRQNNIRFSYFNLFLFCIHQYQSLLLYNQKAVAIGKKIGKSKELKKQLVRFLPTFSFRVISAEITYQQIFLALQKILCLQELEENLEAHIDILEAEYRQKQDKGINTFLTILSGMGIISLILDLLTLLSYFNG